MHSKSQIEWTQLDYIKIDIKTRLLNNKLQGRKTPA